MNITWRLLRVVGNLKIMKVSYAALIIIPITSESMILSAFSGSSMAQFCAYFGSLFLALANLVYDVFCPNIVKRFESPNDLYRDMLSIKALQHELYESDYFDASLNHCKNAYKMAQQRNKVAINIAFVLFVLSAILVSLLLIERTYVFVNSLAK